MKLRYWLGIGLSALLLYLVVRRVDVGELTDSLREANYAYMILVVLVSLYSLAIWAVAAMGVYFAFLSSRLALFGVSEARALAFSILLHATQFFPITILGLAFLWLENLSLRTIRAEGP